MWGDSCWEPRLRWAGEHRAGVPRGGGGAGVHWRSKELSERDSARKEPAVLGSLLRSLRRQCPQRAPGVPRAPVQPRGLCGECFHFTGAAEELLQCFPEDSGCCSLHEKWVLAILKHAAKLPERQHLQGLHATTLRPETLLLKHPATHDSGGERALPGPHCPSAAGRRLPASGPFEPLPSSRCSPGRPALAPLPAEVYTLLAEHLSW